MANTDAIITITNENAIVPRGADYQFDFSISKPVKDTEVTKALGSVSSETGEGKIFSTTIDLSKWKTITKIEVI